MSNQSIRKTQGRVLERERRRAKQERLDKLRQAAPFVAGTLLALLVAGYFFFTSSAGPSQPTAGVNGPQAQVDTDKLDLGDQPLGQTVHASFNVRNAGDGTLTLNPAKIATVLEGC